jgi:2-haloacid dehalogenase
MIDFSRFTHLSFDCYGTLIDWETGILGELQAIVAAHGVTVSVEQLLRWYAQFEAAAEAGMYKRYRTVLREVLTALGHELGFVPTPAELEDFSSSVGRWPPFADTVTALHKLKSRYKLVILSNVDDDLFATTNALLGIEFDAIITAQQVGSYKPNPQNFTTALQRLAVPVSQVLHVAQSLYHDHAPAKALGFTTVWVNRASRLPGVGLALPSTATPDLTVPDLQTLAAQMGL